MIDGRGRVNGKRIGVAAGVLFLVLAAGVVRADDAQVLPKGVARARVDTNFYLPIEDKFDKDGNVVDIAKDYNTPLNSQVFQGVLPPGVNLGASVVSFKYDFTILNFALDYGVTDRLTVGFQVPYWWAENKVSARIDNATANAWISNSTGAPVPVGTPGAHPTGIEDIQALLKNVYGFKRFETWSNRGVGDVEARARHQYFKSTDWRLAFTGGIRFPTGQVDDPDNLVDYAFGTGATALLFRSNNDYTGIPNLTLNGTVRYDLVLPDHQVVRVPADPHQPITANKENVSRNLGDVTELEGTATYAFTKTWSASGTYKYAFKGKDKVSGNRGLAYSSLERETDWTEQVYNVGLSWSTVPLYMEKKSSVPMSASLSYRDRFAGKNNVFKSQYINLSLQLFF